MSFNKGTVKLALASVFAAVYVVLSAIPLKVPVIGAPKAKISLVAFLGPLYGLILGPVTGFLSAFAGALIACVTPPGAPDPWGLATTLCPALAAFTSGCIVRKRFNGLHGWVAGLIPLAALTLAWYTTPVGLTAWYYPILQFSGITLVLAFRDRIAVMFTGRQSLSPLPVLLAGFPAIVTDHMLGNMLFVFFGHIFFPKLSRNPGDLAKLFTAVLPISAAERLTMAALLIVVGTPLIIALRRAGLIYTPQRVKAEFPLEG